MPKTPKPTIPVAPARETGVCHRRFRQGGKELATCGHWRMATLFLRTSDPLFKDSPLILVLSTAMPNVEPNAQDKLVPSGQQTRSTKKFVNVMSLKAQIEMWRTNQNGNAQFSNY